MSSVQPFKSAVGPLLLLMLVMLAPTIANATYADSSTLRRPTPVLSYRYRADDLRYHAGPVVPSSISYVIFWRPRGARFEPQGSDARYMSLMQSYLRDVGGPAFFNILTQYSYGPSRTPTTARDVLPHRVYDRPVLDGPIQNKTRLGGVYVDSTPYPRAGTEADPIRYPDFLPEVLRAMRAKRWTAGITHIFYLFTAGGPRACFVGKTQCLPSQGCSTHVSYGSSRAPIIVDVMADVAAYRACRSQETAGKYAYRSVNHDTVADFEVTVLSHEQFETITDPLDGNSVTPVSTNGWYDENPSAGEIADKCESILDPILSAHLDNVTLHAHRYHVQEEWSNVNHNCVTTYRRPQS